MAKLPLLCLLFSFVLGLQIRGTDAQRLRVCFAQSGDYSTNTALGFCSHGIYMALVATTNADVALINTANDGNVQLGGIARFTSRKNTYPYVEMYLGLVGSGANIRWLDNQTQRNRFISNLLTRLRMHSLVSGVYVDFQGLTDADTADYAAFIASLTTTLGGSNFRVTTALPYDAVANMDIYYSPTLRTLPFNVLKTYEDMYETSTTRTHPISPLFPLAAPFNVETKQISDNVFRWVIKGLRLTNIVIGLPMYSLKFTASGATAFGATATAVVKDTYCNALIFGSTNTAGTAIAGEGFSFSATTFYTYNTFTSLNDKLSFLTATNLGGAAIYSLDQAGSTNAEMLRHVTSVLAPSPPTGFTYPAAGPVTCGVPITFPVPPTTTTTTTPTTTTTTTTPTTTTTTTPTTTTTTTTPTTTTTTTTPTTTTTTTTPTTTTTTTTPTTTTTTTTPTTTTTTTTPTTTTTTTTPTTTSTTTSPTTSTTTTTTPPTTTTTTTPTSTSSTMTNSGSTTAAAPVSAVTCGVAVRKEYGDLVSDYCAGIDAISRYLLTGDNCGTVA